MREPVSGESPLNHFLETSASRGSLEPPGVCFGERPFLGYLNLRGDPKAHSWLDATQQVLGVGLPLEPNTVALGPVGPILWFGPDEWLLVTSPGRELAVAEALRQALGEAGGFVTDVTSGYTTLRLWGPRARDVLVKGCPLDLYPPVFRPGQCAQTLVAKAGVVLRPVDESNIDVIVRRSFAEYLAMWLEDAGGEYGVAILRESDRREDADGKS